ncbi:MAG: KEOPS complex subunit Pcc1 [Candidatus Altiarchaeota archaeon]
MMHKATMLTESKDAKNVLLSISADNKGYAVSELSGDMIRTQAHSDNIRTLLSTLDDMIFCQMVAESVA